MALTKVTYVDNVTVIGATNLNAIQDEIIANGNNISSLQSGKVDKDGNKVLSTNDFTNENLSKLNGIEAQATRVLVDTALSGSSTNAIQNKAVKDALDEQSQRIDNASSSVADVYTPQAYSIGDYVTHDNKLYRATAEIVTPEAWDETHWEEVKLAEYVDEQIDETSEITYALLPQASATGGEIVTIEDGADDVPFKKLTFDITPVQDLHGQENPYPAGGGRNKLNPTGTTQTINGVTFTMNADGTVVANGTATAEARFTVGTYTLKSGTAIKYNGSVGGSASTYCVAYSGYQNCYDGDITADRTSASSDWENAPFFVIVFEGASVSNKVFYPMIRLATETDSTFAPYSNICPITGYTGADVSVTGKNLLPITATTQTINGVTYTVNEDGSVTANGTASSTAVLFLNTQFKIDDSNSYIVSAISGADATVCRMECYWRSNDGVNKGNLVIADGEHTISVSDKTGADKIDTFIISVLSGKTVNNVVFRPMIRFASDTDSTFEPYKNNTYSISFPSSAGTVYSGHVTVEKDGSGTLVVDKANVDLGTLTWEKMTTSGNNYWFRTPLSSVKVITVASNKPNILCSAYKTESPNDAYTGSEGISQITHASYVAVCDMTYGDAAAFKTAMSGVQLVYELATPISYTLSPIQIKSLLGLNHIWASTGDITELIYYVGNQFIDEKIEQEVADATDYALKAYATDTASGAIATFPDGAEDIPIKSLSVAIEPVQDLHGYDNPWPGGGGKNLLDPAKRTTYGSGLGQRWYATDGITLKANQPYTMSVTSSTSIFVYFIDKATDATLLSGSSPQTYTPTEDVVVYLQAYSNVDISSIDTFQLELGSTASAWAPYENICPISGHTECNVTRTGKNLFDPDIFISAGWTETDGAYSGRSANIDRSIIDNFLDVFTPTDKQLTFSYDCVNSNAYRAGYFYFQYSDGTYSAVECPANFNGHKTLTSTAGKIISKLDFGYSNNVPFSLSNVQIEFSSAETTYEPFGNTYSITFPSGTGTVYGGNITVNQDGSGTLVVDKKNVVYDGSSDEGWERYQQGSASAYAMRAEAPNRRTSQNEIIAISNYLKGISASATWGNYNSFISIDLYNDRIVTGLRTITTTEDWKTYLSTNNLQVVYELATPITIPLTAFQIRTLLGQNNVWSDTGDVSVIYRADTAMFIQKKIAEALNA